MPVDTGVRRATRPRAATYAGLALVTLATLVYEIGFTRIFSATMWYHFAFVAISLALLGMTVGALLVHLRPGWFPERALDRRLWLFSLLFAASVPLCVAIELRLPWTPDWSPGGVARMLV